MPWNPWSAVDLPYGLGRSALQNLGTGMVSKPYSVRFYRKQRMFALVEQEMFALVEQDASPARSKRLLSPMRCSAIAQNNKEGKERR